MLLTDDGVLPLGPSPGLPDDDGERTPLLAVGSNASPAQLWHKFRAAGVGSIVPMVPVAVTGLAPGMAAYVARVGYVPATPVLGPDLAADLVVLWLDDAQLARLVGEPAGPTRATVTCPRPPLGLSRRGCRLTRTAWP